MFYLNHSVSGLSILLIPAALDELFSLIGSFGVDSWQIIFFASKPKQMEFNRLLPPKNLAKDVSRIVDRVLGEALSSRKFDLLSNSQRKWYRNHETIHFKQIDSSLNDRIILEIHEILFEGIWLHRIFEKDFSTGLDLPHRSAKPARRSLDRPDGGPFGSTWGEGWPCCFGSESSCKCFEKSSFDWIWLRYSCVEESMSGEWLLFED